MIKLTMYDYFMLKYYIEVKLTGRWKIIKINDKYWLKLEITYIKETKITEQFRLFKKNIPAWTKKKRITEFVDSSHINEVYETINTCSIK